MVPMLSKVVVLIVLNDELDYIINSCSFHLVPFVNLTSSIYIAYLWNIFTIIACVILVNKYSKKNLVLFRKAVIWV